MWYDWEMRENSTGFWLGETERENFETVGRAGGNKIIFDGFVSGIIGDG